jgi:hypothetical protein
MTNFTINNFWKQRLPGVRDPLASLTRGWSFIDTGLAAFMEAPLALNMDIASTSDPMSSSILLVSAPGAVGKSTLARQIAFETDSVYIDLSASEPVGANTLSGGLARSGLFVQWQQQITTVLIDGLDEARLRVTQEAFEAFLSDIIEISKTRKVPTVLFGRTGAIQDAWIILAQGGIEAPILEIGYYSPDAAADFALASLRTIRPARTHEAIERKAIEVLLDRLREQTGDDGDRFAGYAPVLQAVAKRVAEDGNPNALIAQIEAGAQPVTLATVATGILERERGKLQGLQLEDTDIAASLYSPAEQLNRLVARLYQLPLPPLPLMKPNDAQAYSSALDTWVPEHPFLNGPVASSAVFEAMITANALKRGESMEVAVQRELRRGSRANPFLAEFYVENAAANGSYLPPEHVGIVYASLRARLSLGDTASLLVEGPEEADEEEALRAEVEITVSRQNLDRSRMLTFSTEQTGVLRLGPYLEDVEVTASHGRVEIGPGPEAVLIAPISIQCDHLVVTTDKVVVECPSGSRAGVVYLEANSFEAAQVNSVPVLRGDVSLTGSWPTVRSHPWTSFASNRAAKRDPRTDEALRRFRKFVTAFRSHSKGNLRRFQDKIEHSRMTKGPGQAVLETLKREKILTLIGNMYELDPDRLGSVTGATYADCMKWEFNEKTVNFIEGALSS